jgi:hypothetical protein
MDQTLSNAVRTSSEKNNQKTGEVKIPKCADVRLSGVGQYEAGTAWSFVVTGKNQGLLPALQTQLNKTNRCQEKSIPGSQQDEPMQ